MAQPVSPDDRRRLIEKIDRGTPVKDAAIIIQLSSSTAHRIVRLYRNEGRMDGMPRGGRKEARCKVDEEIREFLEAEVNRNPFLTLSEVAQRVNNNFPDKLDIS